MVRRIKNMAVKIVRKNKWARIKSHGNGEYIVEASGPHGWILQSDYVSRDKATDIYKRLSDNKDKALKNQREYSKQLAKQRDLNKKTRETFKRQATR